MESLYYIDAYACWKLQRLFYQVPGSEWVAIAISTLGDPKICYLLAFPVAFFINRKLGSQMLCIIAWAEWLNIVLKWLLLGERPYWWVHTNSDWPSDQTIHQVYITCETGPGVPSGHVMITGCVWWTIANYISQLNKNRPLSNIIKPLTAVFIMLVLISRVLIACHFIHQVLLGLVVVILLSAAYGHLNTWLGEASFGILFMMSLCAGFGSFFIYYVWIWLGFDPSFSIPLAEKYCADHTWVHLDSTPYLSVMRSSGSLFGLAICKLIQQYVKLSKLSTSSQLTPSSVILTIVVLYLWNSVPMAGAQISHILFYTMSFISEQLELSS
ncbi:glucose-6-phosphatase 3-like isoform X2 [Dysidea avara]|uniref:glucose-6-phosphatase 3-like isoform X2 n=1 Tax=Dysidea avara TaxID=196820 RepID=UPI00332216A4